MPFLCFVVTYQTMLKYGVNNVRGSMFCSIRDYHMGHIDALTKFLGHYNNLNYGQVRKRLARTLPLTPEEKVKRQNFHNHMNNGRCYSCGKEGHIAKYCPERHSMTLRP